MILTIHTWFDILQITALLYLGGSALYLFFFALAGRFRRKTNLPAGEDYKAITIVIPAYREDLIISEVIDSIMQQDYPNFKVLLVADSFLPETLEGLKQLPVNLLEAHFEVSTKVNALKFALNYLPPETDIIVVLDADNIPEEGFLKKVNQSFHSGYSVIQYHRIAKNTNTTIALLDAISEEVNNHIFRQGQRAIGLSSALIGSAMAFERSVFMKYIPELNAVAGFDKQLELELLRNRIRIEYVENAFVLDEKVQNSQVFVSQRKRWIYAQLFYFGEDIKRAVFHLLRRGNVDYFNKTVQFSLPPRIILMGLLIAINIAELFLGDMPFRILWLAALVVVLTTFILSVPARFYSLTTLRAILELPRFFFLMATIPFRLKGSNKSFIHTRHTYSASKNK